MFEETSSPKAYLVCIEDLMSGFGYMTDSAQESGMLEKQVNKKSYGKFTNVSALG